MNAHLESVSLPNRKPHDNTRVCHRIKHHSTWLSGHLTLPELPSTYIRFECRPPRKSLATHPTKLKKTMVHFDVTTVPPTCEDCFVSVYTGGLPSVWSQTRDTKRECQQVQPCQTI